MTDLGRRGLLMGSAAAIWGWPGRDQFRMFDPAQADRFQLSLPAVLPDESAFLQVIFSNISQRFRTCTARRFAQLQMVECSVSGMRAAVKARKTCRFGVQMHPSRAVTSRGDPREFS